MFMGRTDLYVAHDDRTHSSAVIETLKGSSTPYLHSYCFFRFAKSMKTKDKSVTTKPLNNSVYKVKVLRIIKILHLTVAGKANKQGN